MKTERLQEVIRTVLLSHTEDLVCAYLFGSVARGEATSTSDVDLALLYREAPPSTLGGLGLDLADELGAALGRAVDVVIMNRASPDLVHRILRDGILIVEHDRAARVRFEVKSRNEYFDVLPYLREYRRQTVDTHGRR